MDIIYHVQMPNCKISILCNVNYSQLFTFTIYLETESTFNIFLWYVSNLMFQNFGYLALNIIIKKTDSVSIYANGST